MERINRIIILFLMLVFFGANLCFAYHVRIAPVNEENYRQMQIGETATFSVEGMHYDNVNDKPVITNENLTAITWEFDKTALEEISRTEYTITLKAVKKKNTYLRIKAELNGHKVEETVGVVIK